MLGKSIALSQIVKTIGGPLCAREVAQRCTTCCIFCYSRVVCTYAPSLMGLLGPKTDSKMNV